MKICTKCKENKTLDEFYKKKSHKDGFNSQCKICVDYNCDVYDKGHSEKIRTHKKNWEIRNPEKAKALKVSYKENNPEKLKATKKNWKSNNIGRVNADTAKRRAAKLLRTPPWLSVEQIEEIRNFYIEAKDLQWLSSPTDPFTVDHIVPLQGENVSGLHVPWNLQILPRSINSSYCNRTK
jgi:hypothetical protein